MGIEFEPFSQSEPLTVRLRDVVREYPKGIGIIKEFIQNADDSGATRLGILLDRCAYSTVGLPTQESPYGGFGLDRTGSRLAVGCYHIRRRGAARLLLEAHGEPRHIVEVGLKRSHKVTSRCNRAFPWT